jgi:hypothetical protein
MSETEQTGRSKVQENEETEILPTLVSALKNDLGPALEEIEVKDVRIGPAPPFMSFPAAQLLVLRVF